MQLLRKISRNWQWIFINILGLTLAYACVALVFSYTTQELSYDRMHSKADRIYRVTTSSGNFSTMHPARVWGQWVPQLPQEYPEIENFVRMVPFKKGVVEIESNRFYSNNLFKVDSSFFEIYDFPLLSGDRETVLTQPYEAVISQSLALKYFGHLDVLGKTMDITHQQTDTADNYTIVGVMEDVPPNAHFHIDVLTTIPDMAVNQSWGYTYYLVQPQTDMEALRQDIQAKWDIEAQENGHPKNIHFQKLTDIHLHSHKTREIEPNGDFKALILLASGGIIILFIALINFLNLSRVQFINEVKSIKIRLIHGATKSIVAREMARESLFISGATILLGLMASYRLSNYLGIDVFASLLPLFIISVIFILGIAAISVFPLLTSKITSDTKVTASRDKLYTFPLILQFTLAVVAITGTIVLNKQMHFLNAQHPQAQNEDIIVLERNSWAAVQRYDQLKEELLKNPSIVNMTGCMEEPGGDILDNFQFTMEGVTPDDQQSMYILTTDANFFSMLGIQPLAGSVSLAYTPDQKWEHQAIELSTLENRGQNDHPRVAELKESLGQYKEQYILNESALNMLGITDPAAVIGRAFRLKFQLPYLFPEGEIVAVVPDFHYTNLHNAERPMVIAPRKVFSYNFLIQIDSNRKEEALAAINTAWEQINPEFPFVYGYINDSYHKVYATEYAQTKVLSLFAMISVLLSALGIYALAAFTMQRRVKEIGVRKVNGASISEIMLMLNRKFVILIGIAFLIAIPLAWYAMRRWLESFAYKTELSWWIFALAGLITMLIALITVSIQSYRAATRNPVESLRYE
ncbi:ABC transporter permease [bacterium SCSIO 12643]|nr:ABC transporter permease [bacterium SCSIO 12643]